jgi:MFS family permease
MSDAEHRTQLRRALIASTVGTTIEWYDFLLYGTVSALVFGPLFFPQSDPLMGVLQSFGIFFIGFVGRPIGAAIFGHWGDRIGRKATLIATLLLTGIATTLVGLVPTYDSIGMWGAVLLTLLRLVQGIGVGGEWGGSVLLAMEWARSTKNRGFLSAWPQFGAPCGLFLATCAVLGFSYLSGDQFTVWGWRIPFLISIVMVGVGMWIRLGISETPVFRRVVAEERVERVPVLEVLKRQPKQVILSALLRLPEQGPGFIVGTFIFTYATTVLGQTRNFVLMAVITQTFIGFIWVVCAGRTVGLCRPQEHVHARGSVYGDLRLHLLCDAQYRYSVGDLRGNRDFACTGDDAIRAGSGTDRREFLAAAALQRHFDWLPTRLDHCRRPGADHRDLAVRDVSFQRTDRNLYSTAGDRRHHLDGLAD